MFKSRPTRRTQQQNPLSDMEHFYMQQYFNQHPQQIHATPPPNLRSTPLGGQVVSPDLAAFAQLEWRVMRLEQHLGLSAVQK